MTHDVMYARNMPKKACRLRPCPRGRNPDVPGEDTPEKFAAAMRALAERVVDRLHPERAERGEASVGRLGRERLRLRGAPADPVLALLAPIEADEEPGRERGHGSPRRLAEAAEGLHELLVRVLKRAETLRADADNVSASLCQDEVIVAFESPQGNTGEGRTGDEFDYMRASGAFAGRHR